MPTRYQQLRQVIANLAAPAEAQDAYLLSICGQLPPDEARAYGNDELALELEDAFTFGPIRQMLECGEIDQEQIDAVAALQAFLEKWSGEENADFWVRDALYTDPRWEEARVLARRALRLFPDEERPGWVPDGPDSPAEPAPRPRRELVVRALPFLVLLHLGGCLADLTSEQYSLLPLFCSITSSAWLSALALAIPFTALAAFLGTVAAGIFARTRHESRAAWAYIVLLALLAVEFALYAANFGSYGCDGP